MIRALWLELVQSRAFNDIKSLPELKSRAQAHLAAHSPWMDGTGFLATHELLAGLASQIKALKLYGYLNHVQLEDSASLKNLIEGSLHQAWTDNLNQFISLPTSLKHFEKYKALRLTAARCLGAQSQSLELQTGKPNSGRLAHNP